MVASVSIRRWTGTFAAPVKTDISNISTRASASDNPTPGSSDPVRIPASGTNRSYWVTTRLHADTAPTGTINNIRWYTDGAPNFGTGVTVMGQTASSYVQATGTAGTSGNELTTGNHAGLTAAPVDVFTFTQGSPKTVIGSTSGTGDFGQFMVFQLNVAATANPGVTAGETFFWAYDET